MSKEKDCFGPKDVKAIFDLADKHNMSALLSFCEKWIEDQSHFNFSLYSYYDVFVHIQASKRIFNWSNRTLRAIVEHLRKTFFKIGLHGSEGVTESLLDEISKFTGNTKTRIFCYMIEKCDFKHM